MIKDINSHTSSSFQLLKDSIISRFKIKPIVQDLDLIRLEDDSIRFLIEVKQSFATNWLPFTKNNKPNYSYSKLDDWNYKALYKLATKIPVELLIFYYMKGKLQTHGIKVFKILNIDLEEKNYGYFSLEIIKKKIKGTPSKKLKLRSFKLTKDTNNPNIHNNSENIYDFFQNEKILHQYYYVEHDGVWTILLSNGKNYEPLWIYIEFNIEQSGLNIDNLDFNVEFFPQIEIHNKIKIPLSIIAYTNSLVDFIIYKYENNTFIKYEMNKQELIFYYSSYIKQLNNE